MSNVWRKTKNDVIDFSSINAVIYMNAFIFIKAFKLNGFCSE